MPDGSLIHFRLLRDRRTRRSLMVVVACLSLLMTFSAWAKNDNRFLLHNAGDLAIVGFMTQEQGEGWSQNWIQGERIMPGETFEMEFAEEGRCEVRARVVTQDRYFQDYLMDFCRTREIFIESNRISYR